MAASAGAPAAPSSRARLLAELGELLGRAAGRFGVALEPPRSGDLGAPVEADVERSLADELLGGRPAPVAGDVARRDGDEVGCDAERLAQLGDPGRPQQVDLDRRRERRVERHRGGRVDDDVGGGEDRPIGVAQAEPVGADVAGDRRDAPIGHGLERLAARLAGVQLPQPVEGVVLEQLLLGANGRLRAPAVADQQDQLAVGDAAQQAFDECRADEPGCPR